MPLLMNKAPQSKLPFNIETRFTFHNSSCDNFKPRPFQNVKSHALEKHAINVWSKHMEKNVPIKMKILKIQGFL